MTKPIAGLDIGHGPSNRSPGVYDPGAIGGTLHEYVAAHGMVNRLEADCVAGGHLRVIVTEGPLATRDDRAKAAGVVAFYSFHFNAFDGKASGVEVFLDGTSPVSKKYAAYVTANLARILDIPNRGIKTKSFAVLRANYNDALTEICFIDNKGDMKAYQAHVDDVELVLYNGILTSLGYSIVKTLPRKPVMYVEPKYLIAKEHIAAIDRKAYAAFAAAHGDVIKFEETTKDSWKEPSW